MNEGTGSGSLFAGQVLFWDGFTVRYLPNENSGAPDQSLIVWDGTNTVFTRDIAAVFFRNAVSWARVPLILNTPTGAGAPYQIDQTTPSVIGIDPTVQAYQIILPLRAAFVPFGDGPTYTFKDIGNFASGNPVTILAPVQGNYTQGSSDGSVTYTDPTATYISNGVLPHDLLQIFGFGPAVGTYVITAVPSETTLTLSTTVPADAGPTPYAVVEGGIDGQLSITYGLDLFKVSIHHSYGYGWGLV